MNISMEEKIPPYMVFGDSTLKELSNRMPITNEQFLDISGVGNSKLNKYGEKFMEKIKSYINENNIEVTWSFISKKNSNISFDEVLNTLGEGLLITEFAGLHSGANAISGDFSLASKGFYIKDGKKAYPVDQITVAGNFF